MFAVGGEDSSGTPTFTLSPYSAVGGFASDFGLAPSNLLTGVISFAADRAATAPAHSDADGSWALYAFGGVGAGAAAAKFNYFTRAWSTVNATGTPPSVRTLSTGVYLPRCTNSSAGLAAGGIAQGCMVVLGGLTAGGVRLADSSVLYVDGLGAGRPSWVQPPSTGAPPPARHSSTMVAGLAGNVAYLFGGDTAVGVANDMYAYAPQGFSPPTPDEMVNIALHAPVAASSSDPTWGGALTYATDGNTLGVIRPGGTGPYVCTSTVRGSSITLGIAPNTVSEPLGTQDPWLRVDLGTTGRVWDGVRFFSRSDCASTTGGTVIGALDCGTRENGWQIAYGDDASSFSSTLNFRYGMAGYACNAPPINLPGGNAFVSCPGAVGRYVWVYLPGVTRLLTVCELQVLKANPWTWRTLSGGAGATVEIAKGKFAQQSSQLSDPGGVGSDANLAVDGETTNAWSSGSCAHTGASTVPGASQQVSGGEWIDSNGAIE